MKKTPIPSALAKKCFRYGSKTAEIAHIRGKRNPILFAAGMAAS